MPDFGTSNIRTEAQTILANVEQLLYLYRNINTNNSKWGINYTALNSVNSAITYALINAIIEDNTSTSEDSYISFQYMDQGVLAERAYFWNNGIGFGIAGSQVQLLTTGISGGAKDFTLPNLSGEITTLNATQAILNKTIDPKPQFKRWITMENDFTSPTTMSHPFDDFGSGTGAAMTDLAEAGVLGIMNLSTGTTTTGRMALMSNYNAFVTGLGEMTYLAIIKIPTLSTITERFVVRIGFGDTESADFVDGAYIEYEEATSPNWRTCTANNSTRTKTTSTLAVGTGWVALKIIINAAGTSVSYFVNGTALSTSPITTNIPTANTAARAFGTVCGITKSLGTTARNLYVDYIGVFVERTTERSGY